ncbi:tyrosine-type recombinase/integrase [Celeribacter marinus]|uniref:Site-specific recombinase, phage integrase family n=1 Tax=Celeribacter marinus TaxID=1397108 RepID=A0A0N9ZE32_9RHOB|nr:tyrosine-type recombinase/integrase [Celeribacter marinus]ALI54577.1 site-specific recombinase, phage integrase family [Celeribacter marinus]SFK49974.1 Phage integrase family protein [Celeribacter marinus]
MSKSYLNKVELKDGQIILFHRQHAKRPIYHMRIHVRGMQDVYGNKVTYVQESTGETDLEEARRYALDKYDDLRLRAKKKEPVKQLTFEDLYVIWWADKRQRLEALQHAKGRNGISQRVTWYEKHAQRYWLPYFGTMKLDEMTHAFVQGYWNWRMTYWARADEAERKRHANHALQPAKKSMDMEQSALREIFGWANSMKLILHMPIIENTFVRQGIAAKRRPSFSHAEYMELQDYMQRWVDGRGVSDERVNSAHKYNRQLLKFYLTWLAETGMRTGEVLQLKHKDISVKTSDKGQQYLEIIVPKNTKTGTRIVRSHYFLNVHYQQLCKLTGHTDANDWVFCDASGKQNNGFYKTLPKMLEEAGLLYDENGDRRTAYSLRHYYAEERFRDMGYNLATYDMLAENMGTSRKQIDDHYVRKGMLMDVDVLLSTEGRAVQRGVAATGATEAERARRKLDAMQSAAKRRR